MILVILQVIVEVIVDTLILILKLIFSFGFIYLHDTKISFLNYNTSICKRVLIGYVKTR